MGEISKALGVEAGPVELHVGDKTYLVDPITKRVQAGFEQWLEGQARREASAMRPDLTDEDFAALMASVADKIVSGHYSFTGRHAARVMRSLRGAAALFAAMLKRNHPGITVDAAEELMLLNPREIDTCIRTMLPETPAGN